ncbi:MAG: hypothetical protein ACYSU7_10670 [Planctomycetota bacterium]|jgi:DNA anti-recombination protein RmuC
MRITNGWTLALSALLLIPLAGCGQQEETGTPDAAKDSGVMPTDLGSQIGQAVNETASALAKNYASELDQQESQVKSLKTSAQTLADDKLNQLLSSLDAKLAAARGKLNDIQKADQGSAQALGTELKTLLGEAQKLYQQALDRVAQLKGG